MRCLERGSPLIRGLWLAFGLWLALGESSLVEAQIQGDLAYASETWTRISPAGKVVLERVGPMVRATVRLPLASVSPVIPPAASHLLTMPRRFRPVQTVQQTVGFRVTARDGTRSENPRPPLYLQVGVDPYGAVSFQPTEGSGLPAGTGAVWVEGVLLWPVFGTSPLVCQRGTEVRNVLLLQLADQGLALSCEEVTWSHLASIRTLPYAPQIEHVRDLYGLVGLQEAALRLQPEMRAAGLRGVLTHLPRLRTLRVEFNHVQTWPTDTLSPVPWLSHLTVSAARLAHLPARWLAPVPGLQELSVSAPRLATAPSDWLGTVPRLRSLRLAVGAMEELAPDWLTQLPHLRSLHLSGEGWETLPATWLSHAPTLERLGMTVQASAFTPSAISLEEHLAQAPPLNHLYIGADTEFLPAGYLPRAPRVTRMTMDSNTLTHIEDEFLVEAPHLTQLDFASYSMAALPDGFLADVPHLTRLTMWIWKLQALPSGFLTRAPRLEELELIAPPADTPTVMDVAAVPPDFLTATPSLRRLRMDETRLQELPAGFLSHTPRLLEARLRMPHLTAVPPGFLSDVPQVETLDLEFNQVTSFPPGFLAHVPRLQVLRLEANQAVSFPPGFLANVPQLQVLELQASQAVSFPPGFLADIPQLQVLKLEANQAVSLPPGFLAHAPQATRLTVETAALGPTVPPGLFSRLPAVAHLQWRAGGVTRLPPAFLQTAPNLEHLHLWLPQLDPPPTRDGHLGALLMAHSSWVAAAAGTPLYGQGPEDREELIAEVLPADAFLWVGARLRDEIGREWLEVWVPVGEWSEYRWVLADTTVPTVQVREEEGPPYPGVG